MSRTKGCPSFVEKTEILRARKAQLLNVALGREERKALRVILHKCIEQCVADKQRHIPSGAQSIFELERWARHLLARIK